MSLKASTIPRLILAEADTDIVAAGLPPWTHRSPVSPGVASCTSFFVRPNGGGSDGFELVF